MEGRRNRSDWPKESEMKPKFDDLSPLDIFFKDLTCTYREIGTF